MNFTEVSLKRWRSPSLFHTVLIHTALILATLTLTACGGGNSMAPVTVSAQGNPPSSGPGSTPVPTPSPTPTPTPGPAPSPTPPPPPGVRKVIDNIEDSTSWLTCGACGNAGGTGAIAQYSVTPNLPNPSEDGSATQFSIAATVPFTNAYWYIPHPVVQNQFTMLNYEFDLMIPNGTENLPQAIEFECQQILGGWIYNFAFQADYGRNLWRVFDYGSKTWESASIPLQRFAPGTWHHIMAEYHSDTATHTVFHDALTVDGIRYTINMTHNAFFSGSSDQFTNAFQLDSNSHSDPYSVYVDKMKITYE